MKRNILAICACGVLLALVAVGSGQSRAQVKTHPAAAAQAPWLKAADQEPERKVNSLILKWKAAEDDAARSKAEDELRGALKEAFDARLTAHEQQIQELEARVKQLREQLDRRREKQDEIVAFRLQQLLREAQGLGWGTEPTTRLPGRFGW